MSRPARIITMAALLVISVVVVATTMLRSGAAAVDHIILITIDTLRADHLGCYGYPRATSPFLDRLARDGIRFEWAFTSMSSTFPSLSTMFTSLYPVQHRVLKNGHRLHESYITLAEELREEGYYTAAFVPSSGYYRSTNLGQGFDLFDEPQTLTTEYRQSPAMAEAVTAWLEQQHLAERLFIWVHFVDPHQPLIADQHYLDMIACRSSSERLRLVRYYREQHRLDAGFFGHDEQRMLDLMDSYDAEIRSVDDAVQRIFSCLQHRTARSRQVWIVVSDHGEGLGNHGWLEHGKHIYNEQLRVPLLLWFSSGKHRGRVVPTLVETVDLMPTVLELAAAGGEPRQAAQGRSLLPITRESLTAREAFAQRRVFSPITRRGKIKVEVPGKNFEQGDKYALQNGRYKYIHRTDGPDELYDLQQDPYEVDNLIGGGLEEEHQLREELLARVRSFEVDSQVECESIDEESIEQLEALGYVQ